MDSPYRVHVDGIAALLNQVLDASLTYRRVLEDELLHAEGRRGYQWVRLRKRAIGEIDDLIGPIQDVALDRVIRLVDRVIALDMPDNDEDFV